MSRSRTACGYEPTVEWWTGTVPDGRRRVDVAPRELAEIYPELDRNAWSNRRGKAKDKLQGVLEFPFMPTGGAATARPGGAPVEPPIVLTTEEKVDRDRKMVKLKAERDELARKYKLAVKNASLTEQVLAMAAEILPRLKPAAAAPKAPRGNTRNVESALLRWADWHCDEVVSGEIMEGLNTFGPDIAVRRAQFTVDRTIDICRGRYSTTDFRALVVHDLGDGITGALHEENKYTNALPPFMAIVFCADLKARALRDLAAHFPHVYYRSVPGNHWRYSPKIMWKLPTETSDWLIGQFIAARCADVPNLTIEAPARWSMTSEIEGKLFSLNHGYTDAKGGFGGISHYGFMKSDAKRSAIDARLGRHVYGRDYGHIHQKAELPRAGGTGHMTICPSLKGGDEYAKEGGGGTYSDPAQLLSLVNAQHGEWTSSRLDVFEYDTLAECRYDAALEILEG